MYVMHAQLPIQPFIEKLTLSYFLKAKIHSYKPTYHPSALCGYSSGLWGNCLGRSSHGTGLNSRFLGLRNHRTVLSSHSSGSSSHCSGLISHKNIQNFNNLSIITKNSPRWINPLNCGVKNKNKYPTGQTTPWQKNPTYRLMTTG